MIIDDAARARHITDLCAAFDIVLKVVPGMKPDRASAGVIAPRVKPPTYQEFRTLLAKAKSTITIAPVTDETTYAVALHELGHRLHPIGCLKFEMSDTMFLTNRYSSARDIKLTLESERAAWDWAMHNCLGRDWTDVMDIVRVMALRSYERDAKKILGFVP